MTKYDEDYLNGLIKKAKKSWEGVDVDSYMNNLRDDSFDKEVAEELSKEVTSYIIEQIKSKLIISKFRKDMIQDLTISYVSNGIETALTIKDDYSDNIPYNLAYMFEKVIRKSNANPQIVIENLKSAFEYE